MNATWFPKAVSCCAGRVRTGLTDGMTITRALTEVEPICTVTEDGCWLAAGVATSLKLSSVWRGRDVIKAGTSRLGLLVVRPSRAIWGMLGEFSRIRHVIELPAWMVSAEHARAVGRIPATARAVVRTAPCTLAAICTCASWSLDSTFATNWTVCSPAGICTCAGSWTLELSACKLTTVGFSAACARETVQSNVPVRVVSGAQESAEMLPCPTVSVTVWLLGPRDAVIWNETPAALGAVTENVAVVLPAGTTTEEGTTRPLRLAGADSATVVTFAALFDMTTVQVVVPPGGTVPDPQLKDDTAADACRVNAAVAEELPKLAVRVAGSSAVGDPAVTEKDAVLEPDGTITVAGADRSGLLLATRSVTPPGEAAFVKVAVQAAVAPEPRVAGEHASEDRPAGADESMKVRVTPFMLAVSTAELAAGAALTVKMKFALLAPGGMFTKAGRLTSGVPVRVTEAVSAPIARLAVTVQLSWAPGLKVAGLHNKDVKVAGASTDTTTIFDVNPSVTVTFTI